MRSIINKLFGIIGFLSREKLFYVWQILSQKEKITIMALFVVIIATSLTWTITSYIKNTMPGPGFGGTYHEAILGEPRYINPIIAQTNDVDRDLSQLIFSGLMKYDVKGNLQADLAEKYEISEDGRTYTFYLRKDVKWHDGADFKADDVVFTIKTIQNIEYRSPIRINWQGVSVEKVDDYTVKFILNNIYAPFLENTAVGIAPKHIWQDIDPSNFPLAEFNLKPVGSGPYQLKKLEKDKLGQIKSVELESYGNYHLGKGYIKKLKLSFYESPEIMIQMYNNKLVDGLNFLSAKSKDKIKNNINIYFLKSPRYFAIFFNQNQSRALADKTVRLALNYATDKRDIVSNVLLNDAEVIDSPMLSSLTGYTAQTKIYDFALEHAINILDEAGWRDFNGDGFREKEFEKNKKEKETEPLEITLTTTSWPELVEVAEKLKDDWQKIGVKTNIEIVDVGGIQQEHIKPRKYQALLFGQILSSSPDPFSFWHSSQKKDPGLNLALYDNDKVDKLLEEARQTLDDNERAKKYEEFQQLLIEDAPVVFLYSPYYLYAVSEKVKGIDIENVVTPSQRFSDVNKWYIKTTRVKK